MDNTNSCHCSGICYFSGIVLSAKNVLINLKQLYEVVTISTLVLERDCRHFVYRSEGSMKAHSPSVADTPLN